jgi:hypothetical protein
MYSYGLFTHAYLFQKCQPYIESMLQSSIPSLSITSKSLCKYFFNTLRNYSLEMNLEQRTNLADVEKYFNFMQSFINFMAACPDNKERTDAFNLLNEFISKFQDDARYELLVHTLRTCPYPSLLGLMMHRLKEEIRLEYDSMLNEINRGINLNNPYKPEQPLPVDEANKILHSNPVSSDQVPAQPPMVEMDNETIRMLRLMGKNSRAFLQKDKVLNLLLEVLPKYVRDPDVDSLDVVLHGLNLIYFLLLRDAKANISGIMDGEMSLNIQSKIIEPLKDTVQIAQEKLEKEINKSQDKMLDEDEEEDVDTDDLDIDAILDEDDPDLTEEDRQMLRELQQEKQEKEKQQSDLDKKLNFVVLPQQEKIQLRLRFFMVKDVLASIDTIWSPNKNTTMSDE